MATNARRAERARHLIEEGHNDGVVRDEDIISPHERRDDEAADETADLPHDDGDSLVDQRRLDLMEVMAHDVERGRSSMPPGCRWLKNGAYLVEDGSL